MKFAISWSDHRSLKMKVAIDTNTNQNYIFFLTKSEIVSVLAQYNQFYGLV